MGCGNSSPANSTNKSSGGSSTAGPAESSSKGSEESAPEDEKWKNYGGVYVGFPTDMSNIPQVQIGSLRDGGKESYKVLRVRKARRPSGGRCGGTDSNSNEEPGATRKALQQQESVVHGEDGETLRMQSLNGKLVLQQ